MTMPMGLSSGGLMPPVWVSQTVQLSQPGTDQETVFSLLWILLEGQSHSYRNFLESMYKVRVKSQQWWGKGTEVPPSSPAWLVAGKAEFFERMNIWRVPWDVTLRSKEMSSFSKFTSSRCFPLGFLPLHLTQPR